MNVTHFWGKPTLTSSKTSTVISLFPKKIVSFSYSKCKEWGYFKGIVKLKGFIPEKEQTNFKKICLNSTQLEVRSLTPRDKKSGSLKTLEKISSWIFQSMIY